MAIVLNNVNYAGEAASQFIVKATTGLDTVQGGHIFIQDGIKQSFAIPRLDVDLQVQDRLATPVAAGSIDIDERSLIPQDYMIYDEFNPRKFENHWFAQSLNNKLLDAQLPVSIESQIVQEYMKLHSQYLEKNIWQAKTTANGGAAPNNKFNGLIQKMLDDAAVIDVAGAVTLTSANIEAKFQLVLDEVVDNIDALLYDLSAKFYVSYKTAQLWERAQAAATNKGINNTEAGLMRFQGRPVVRLAGMPNDTIIFAKGSAGMDSNLWLGMNSTEDTSIQLAKLQANSELYFIKILMKVDVNHGFGEEIVLYNV